MYTGHNMHGICHADESSYIIFYSDSESTFERFPDIVVCG